MNHSKDVLLVTGGYVDIELLKTFYKANDDLYIVGVDKGLESLYKAEIKPDMIIGDFDSACDSIRTIYIDSPDAIVLNPEKDFSDTHAAVLKVFEMNPNSITIIGGTGSRIDHMMGTIGLLKLCHEKNINATILDKNNRIRLINDSIAISKANQYGKYVSCIPFSDKVTGVCISGFKYDADNIELIKEDTIGVSNELREEEGLITIKTGYLLVFETKD